jgi:hypothetical protein
LKPGARSQEFRSSGVQEFRSSGVQEFRRRVGKKIAFKVKNYPGLANPNISPPGILLLLNS